MISSYQEFYRNNFSKEDLAEIKEELYPFSEMYNIKEWENTEDEASFQQNQNQYSVSVYTRMISIGIFLFKNEEEIVDDIKGMFIPLLESKGYTVKVVEESWWDNGPNDCGDHFYLGIDISN